MDRLPLGIVAMMVKSLWGLFAAILMACGAAIAAPDRPVIVIPGILGSKLCDAATGRVVWGNAASLFNFAELAIPVQHDGVKPSHINCGLIDSIQILGPWRLHQYDDLLETLRNVGYRAGVDLFVFDYDWRLSNEVNAVVLAQRLQAWVGDREVDIVAHSMGGIIARILLDLPTMKQRVKRVVTLGTPYRGSADALRTLDRGWGFWENLAARGLDSVRQTAATFPSFYELLPAYKQRDCCSWRYSDGRPSEKFNIFDAAAWQRFAFMPPEFRTPNRKAWLEETLRRAERVQNQMASRWPAEVRRWAVATALISTPWHVEFDARTGSIVGYSERRGDGTVIDYSAVDWDPDLARAAVTAHQRIFSDDATRQTLRWILASGREPTSGLGIDMQARLVSADGKKPGISMLSYAFDPAVVRPGETTTLNLKFVGEPNLATADLSNVTAKLDAGEIQLPQKGRVVDAAGSVQILFHLKAPMQSGPYSVSMQLPGVGTYQEYLFVAR